MDTTIRDSIKGLGTEKMVVQPLLQRIVLLIILGYEAAGSLVGGSFLVAAPDGRYMDLQVGMMHGVFSDFLVPGIILFGLGILNTLAFVSVLRRTRLDWLMAGIALGGLFFWFIVEIIILHELHWLHAMWGLPVMLGWMVVIPLMALRNETERMRKILLFCGILSSLWYAAINIIVPPMYDGYSMVSVTVSELSAIGAPTRVIWVVMVAIYPILYAAFGWGVLKSAEGNRYLRIAGTVILLYCIMNIYWPPMHMREVIAAGNGTLTDTLHIVWAMLTIVFMMLMMGFGAAGLGKRFRLFTIATFVIFIAFGILIAVETPGIDANLPTPRIGLWERINIGVFMLWVVVLGIVLIQKREAQGRLIIN